MHRANPFWGAPRIHGELQKLGIEIAEPTVATYLGRRPASPSPTWRTFLRTHLSQFASMDFFTVPTATFRVLFVLVILSHDRCRIVHLNVTGHPTAAWTRPQTREAFPDQTAPAYLIRDRDGSDGPDFSRLLQSFGTEEILIAPRAPWQNPYVERLIGTLRRECLDFSWITFTSGVPTSRFTRMRRSRGLCIRQPATRLSKSSTSAAFTTFTNAALADHRSRRRQTQT
jgi:transposase InsO family protein